MFLKTWNQRMSVWLKMKINQTLTVNHQSEHFFKILNTKKEVFVSLISTKRLGKAN